MECQPRVVLLLPTLGFQLTFTQPMPKPDQNFDVLYFFCQVGKFQLQGNGFKKIKPQMSPENQWLGSMAFPIEIVTFWGVVSEKSPRNGQMDKSIGEFPKMVGFPNNHEFFQLKTIILGWRLGVPPFKETSIQIYTNFDFWWITLALPASLPAFLRHSFRVMIWTSNWNNHFNSWIFRVSTISGWWPAQIFLAYSPPILLWGKMFTEFWRCAIGFQTTKTPTQIFLCFP